MIFIITLTYLYFLHNNHIISLLLLSFFTSVTARDQLAATFGQCTYCTITTYYSAIIDRFISSSSLFYYYYYISTIIIYYERGGDYQQAYLLLWLGGLVGDGSVHELCIIENIATKAIIQ